MGTSSGTTVVGGVKLVVVTGSEKIKYTFLLVYIVKTVYSDILYNSKILNNVNCICTNVSDQLEFAIITTEIQFNIKLFADKQCLCKEG